MLEKKIRILFGDLERSYFRNMCERMAEIQSDGENRSGLMLDFDIYFKEKRVLITPDLCRDLVESVVKYVASCFFCNDTDSFHVVVIRKPPYKHATTGEVMLNYDDKHGLYKDGMHLIFPDLQLRKDQRKILIRSLVLSEICKQFAIRHNIPIINPNEILDINSAHVPVLLIGSAKKSRSYFYRVTSFYCYKGASGKLEELDIPDEHICEFSINRWGIERLIDKSNLWHYTEILKNQATEFKKQDEETEKKHNEYQMDPDTMELLTEKNQDVKMIIWDLCDGLDSERAVQSRSWRCVLECLVWFSLNIGIEDDDLKNIFVDFSRKSTKHTNTDDELHAFYDSQKDRGVKISNGLRLLLWFIKQDNLTAFKDINHRLKELIPHSLVRKSTTIYDEPVFADCEKWGKTVMRPWQVYDHFQKTIRIVNKGARYFFVKTRELNDIGLPIIKWVSKDKGALHSGVDFDVCLKVKIKIVVVEKKVRNKTVSETQEEEDDTHSLDESADVCEQNKADLYKQKIKPLSTLLENQLRKAVNEKWFIPFFYDVHNDPYPCPEGYFNLCNVFPIRLYDAKTEKKYENSIIKSHIDEIICSENEELIKYIHGYIAHMIQQPHDLPGVGIILYSRMKGTGKGSFIEFIDNLTGAAHSISSMRDFFASNFNAEISGKLVVHIDETDTNYNMSRTDVSKLRSLITSKKMTINEKNVPKYEIHNCIRWMFSTNHDDAIYVDAHERRYCVIKVSAEKAQDHEYFAKYLEEIKDLDMLRSAYDYYKKLDISKFNVRSIPRTLTFNEFKKNSFCSAWRFLIDHLHDPPEWLVDCIYEPQGEEAEGGGDNVIYRIKPTHLYVQYTRWMENNGERTIEKSVTFAKKLEELNVYVHQCRNGETRERVFEINKNEVTKVLRGIFKDNDYVI
jgi:hypothetical protein